LIGFERVSMLKMIANQKFNRDNSELIEKKSNKIKIPLYDRVYKSLLKQINDEIYTFGVRLPGEHQLCEKFNVSRITVRRALLRLENEGLVSRQAGKGTFVTRPSKGWRYKLEPTPLTEHIAQESAVYESRRLEFIYMPTPDIMNSGPDGYGPVVLRVSRLSLLDGVPVHYHFSFVPERLSRNIDSSSVETRPVADVLHDRGVEVAEVEFTVDAVNADEEMAEYLSVPMGAALIRARQFSRAADGRPIEFATTLSRPERFLYRFRSNERERIIAAIPGLRLSPSGSWI
jgi:GntR family transcriptional regulator